MKKEFIPYKQALALKKLGFDEPCFGYYYSMDNKKVGLEMYIDVRNQDVYYVSAPLYQQAFRWFREKYNLYVEVKVEDSVRLGEQKYYWIIFGEYKSFEGSPWIRCLKDSKDVMFNTYEDAELECLKKLIEIVKSKL
jgi:hypothetical protein